MMDFKVEYVQERNLSTLPWSAADRSTPVVRLAEVEKLLDTAVMHAQWLVQITDGESDENQDARAFLASVAAWRKGQEDKK